MMTIMMTTESRLISMSCSYRAKCKSSSNIYHHTTNISLIYSSDNNSTIKLLPVLENDILLMNESNTSSPLPAVFRISITDSSQ